MNDDLPSTAAQETIEEQLVAYLDDELDADAAAEVERKLAADPTYQKTLHELQKTWDLLDNLPQARVGDRFTQTTVELVAYSAATDAEKRKSNTRVRQRLLRLGSVAAAVLAGLAGYVLVTMLASRGDYELVRDLPVIENVDAYRYADSVEFLEQLDQEGLFAEQESGSEM
jgi:anti-sigma factor RsiW